MSTKGINASNRVPPNAANHSQLTMLQLPRPLLHRGHYADTPRVPQLSRPSRRQAGRLQLRIAREKSGMDGCSVLCGHIPGRIYCRAPTCPEQKHDAADHRHDRHDKCRKEHAPLHVRFGTCVAHALVHVKLTRYAPTAPTKLAVIWQGT